MRAPTYIQLAMQLMVIGKFYVVQRSPTYGKFVPYYRAGSSALSNCVSTK